MSQTETLQTGTSPDNWIAHFEEQKRLEDDAREKRKHAHNEAAHQAAVERMSDMETQMQQYMKTFPQEVTYRIEKDLVLMPRLAAPGLGGRPEHWNATIELIARYKNCKEVPMNIYNTDQKRVALYLLGDETSGCTGAVYNNRFSVEESVID